MPLPTVGTYAGSYNATWAALPIGQVAPGGFRLRYMYDQKPIMYDSVGSSPVDALFMGLTMYIDFVCMESNQEAFKNALMAWPFDVNNIAGGLRGTTATAGYSIWRRSRPFIMTSCLPGTVDPLTITFPRTYLAPGFEVALDHSGVTERTVPMRLIVFPTNAFSTPGNSSSGQTLVGSYRNFQGLANQAAQAAAQAGEQPPNGCGANLYFVETLNA